MARAIKYNSISTFLHILLVYQWEKSLLSFNKDYNSVCLFVYISFIIFYIFLCFLLMFSNVGCCLIVQLINGSFGFYNNLNFNNFIFLLVLWFLSFERTFKSDRHEAFIFFVFSHNDIEKRSMKCKVYFLSLIDLKLI